MAESLMGVVLTQLRRPGCPVGAGCNFAVLDMRTGLTAIAAPEMSIGLAAQAELARHFATAYPHRRAAFGPWRLPTALRPA
jgi:trimethylamine--corrinoid protein Co-methyltransferase